MAFEDDVRSVLGRLRGAYADLLAELGLHARPVDVETGLGLDKKLAWRVHRVACAPDPLVGVAQVPTRAAARRVQRAAKERGARAATTSALSTSTAEFERLIEAWSPDRAAFDAMVSAISGDGFDQVQFDARRAAFKANAVLQGKFSELSVFAFLASPGATAGHFDGISLRGHVDLQRLRRAAAVEIARHRFDYAGEVVGSSEPLDPSNVGAAPVLTAFSSDELPTIEHATAASGFRRTYLANPDVGSSAALTCLLGDVSLDLPIHEALGSLCELATPTRCLVHDFIVHRDLPVDPPELRVLARRSIDDSWPGSDSPEVLPPAARVVDLGFGADGPGGLGGLGLAQWPRYAELVRWAFAQRGWDPTAFRTYRVLVDYPVHHSVVWLRAASTAEQR